MHVCTLSFCDVKGTRHRDRDHILLTGDGVAGDRRLALACPTRRVVLKTVQHPALTLVTASIGDGELTITLPGDQVVRQRLGGGEPWTVEYWGRPVSSRSLPGPVSEALSDYLGAPAVLVEPLRPGGFVYGAPVSLWLTSSLRELEHRVGTGLDPRRFRLTIGIDEIDATLDEDRLVGQRLRIGGAEITVTELIDRCAIVDWDVPSASKDQPVLQTLAGYRRRGKAIVFGLGGRTLIPGPVRNGDPVSLS